MNEQKLTTVGEYAYKQSRTRDFLKRYGMALVFIAPHLIFFLAFCIYFTVGVFFVDIKKPSLWGAALQTRPKTSGAASAIL